MSEYNETCPAHQSIDSANVLVLNPFSVIIKLVDTIDTETEWHLSIFLYTVYLIQLSSFFPVMPDCKRLTRMEIRIANVY